MRPGDRAMAAAKAEFGRFVACWGAEIKAIYEDLQRTPVGVLILISCLALLLAATILFKIQP